MEAWAERNNLFLLAVSSDKGWENFAKNSSRIAVTDKLDIALSTLQPIHFIKNNGNNLPVVISSYEKNVMEFQSIFAADEHNSILEAIDLAIIDSLDGIEIQADACSSYYFEEDYLETEYSYHEIVLNDDDVPEIHVIRADSNEVIIELSALVTCKISASFRLSTWDSMDKEYICVGSTSKKQTETYQTDILITLAGTRQALHKNLNTAEKTKALEILKIEILKDALDVHFGDLELDWD